MKTKINQKVCACIVGIFLLLGAFDQVAAEAAEVSEASEDKILYEKYEKFRGYEKGRKYRKYKECIEKYQGDDELIKKECEKVEKYKEYEEYDVPDYEQEEFWQYGADKFRQGWLRYKEGGRKIQMPKIEVAKIVLEKEVGKSVGKDESESKDEVVESDKILYAKYEKYMGYEKHHKYRKYVELRKIYKEYQDKYAFDTAAERHEYEDAYENYKKYKENRNKYAQYKNLKNKYERYEKYKSEYKPAKEAYKKVSKHKKYEEYNDAKYGKEEYAQYDTPEIKQGWVRYKQENKETEADLEAASLGPEITVGLFEFSKDDLRNGSFRVTANKDYVVMDMEGNSLGTISAGTKTKVRYDSGGMLKVDGSMEDILVDREVRFEATDDKETDLIFEIVSPYIKCYSANCNKYRGKLKLRYSPYSKKIWLINTLPMEQYVWGMGEITGTGDRDYNDTMTTAYRTYGYWKIKYSTKFASEGFKVNATPGNQLYFGYVWEQSHQRIKDAAQKTRGKLVMYDDKLAIVPYSSWTDGKTRSFKEKWGSDNFPWCQSVSDYYGKHPSKSYSQLQAEGNHMVGVSAHGALDRADAGWDYERILKYYLTGVNIHQGY